LGKTQKKRLALLASFALVLLFFCLPPRSAYAQAVAPQAEQEETLETLGSQIHTSLGALKARCQTLTAELEEQSEKAKELQTKLIDLSSCLTDTNKTLCDYETKLITYENKLKARAKVIWAAAIVILINILGKVAAIALRFKGIKLPELLNILW
jgi:septal ring factor EnvC (AmiA/AmiB activator)